MQIDCIIYAKLISLNDYDLVFHRCYHPLLVSLSLVLCFIRHMSASAASKFVEDSIPVVGSVVTGLKAVAELWSTLDNKDENLNDLIYLIHDVVGLLSIDVLQHRETLLRKLTGWKLKAEEVMKTGISSRGIVGKQQVATVYVKSRTDDLFNELQAIKDVEMMSMVVRLKMQLEM